MFGHRIYDTLNSLEVWERMSPITLDRMRSIKLMNRIDTKYVLSFSEALELLDKAATAGYLVQQSESRRAFAYDTLYYDTHERTMYVRHHNQELQRQKIRTRTYLETGLTFLEIKEKTNCGRTKKRRIEIDRSHFTNFATDSSAVEFYTQHSAYDLRAVTPSAATRFVRVTLVNSTLSERITLDFDLHYEDVRSGNTAAIDDMVILELKQEGHTASTMKQLLSDLRIPPFKVSKYCLATALTVGGIKKNRYKAKLRDIEKRLYKQSNILTIKG